MKTSAISTVSLAIRRYVQIFSAHRMTSTAMSLRWSTCRASSVAVLLIIASASFIEANATQELSAIMSTERMTIFAMGWFLSWMLFKMFFSAKGNEMSWITARSIFAQMMEDCFRWWFSDQQYVGDTMNTFRSSSEARPAVTLLFSSLPEPTIGFGINKDFSSNSYREAIQHYFG